MATPEPTTTHSNDAPIWSPPLPPAEGFEHLVVSTPGLRTHLAAIGEGEPVVMLHGFPQHWWQWHAIAPVVAEAGYRVLCPDLRGAGWTAADDLRIGRETRLRDLLAIFDALGIDRAHLVSHDMGAITALQLSYEHPLRVRTAVQLSVPPGFMAFSPKVMPGFRHLPAFIWHKPGASLRQTFAPPYVAHPMHEAAIEAHLAPMRRPEIDRAVRRLTRGMILPEAMRLARGAYRRRRLTVPTLIAVGRQDYPWAENLEHIARHPERHADHVELAYIDNAAHFVTDDNPSAVAELILDWLTRAT
ncbi:alpha/beta hydrolase [Kribbella sp. NPDC048915]|uniref:alpha/beta fold hydrolase n=1 Tax=Kribbella sp. NPDC048915 TaxID=3155148 RepID=UPI0034077EB5